MSTIDKAGRIVIPKRIRERLGLRGGEQVEIEELDGRIEIRRKPREGTLVRTEHGLLAWDSGPALGPEEVREILERTRARDL